VGEDTTMFHASLLSVVMIDVRNGKVILVMARAMSLIIVMVVFVAAGAG
jgi:hypothetical protein